MDAWLQKNRGYLILALVEAILFATLFLWRLPRPAPIEILNPTRAKLVVYISGAVEHPDVYTLASDSRLQDALRAAGGARAEADLDALNLAAPLQDGQRVHIPAKGEAPLAPSPAGQAAEPGALLNVNTATAAELDALPGIGPALAQRIVEEREANGPYTNVDDLARVPGIGPALVEKLRPLVTVR